MIKVKIVPINEIISSAVSSIQTGINEMAQVSVQIDIGKVTGIPILSRIGPSLNIKLETSRRSKNRFKI